jgi:upstream activation factor subunit UAF30
LKYIEKMSTEGVKKSSKKTTQKVVKNVEEPVVVEPELAKKEKKVRKSAKAVAVEPEPEVQVVEPEQPAAEVEADQPAAEGESDEKLSRKKKNHHQLLVELDSLSNMVEQYVENHKDLKVQGLSKLLKDLEKGLKKAKNKAQKLGKSRGNSQPSGNQSGFQKPVHISAEVAAFTGWNVDEPRARVDVTNFICEYIKANKLQDPKDGRVILADEKLSNLLQYSADRDGKLTYATIQRLLAKHYKPLNAAQ